MGAYQQDTQTTQSRHCCVTDGKTSEVTEAKITSGFWPLLPLASSRRLYYVGRANKSHSLLGSKLVCPAPGVLKCLRLRSSTRVTLDVTAPLLFHTPSGNAHTGPFPPSQHTGKDISRWVQLQHTADLVCAKDTVKGGRSGLCRNILCLWLPHHPASSSQKTRLSRMSWYMTLFAGEVHVISVEYINWCYAEIRRPSTGPFSSRRILPMTRTLRSLPKRGSQSEAFQRNHIKRTWYGPEGFPCSFANLVSLHLSRHRK